MFPTFISILDIQSWWEVPSIAHFCSLFRTAFNLLDFDIEDLEDALLTDGTEESSWLQELIVRLLSGCLPNNEISTFNYQMFLRRLFRQKCQEHDQYNPFNTDIDFQLLPLRTKVDILHALCDFRLDADDVLDQLKNLEADSLRVEPLGYDSNDSAYWYFYGTRLYREDFKTKNNKKKSVWQVICFTEEDWFQLNKKFKKSTVKCERELHRTLSENFLPELPRLFREKERLARKRLLENQPRRTSRRLRKENIIDKEELNCDIPKTNTFEEEEEQSKRDLEFKKEESYDRSRLKEPSEDSQSDNSESRYEMGGPKARQKKSKSRQRKLSTSSSNSKDASAPKNSKRKKTNEDNTKSSSSSTTTTVGRQTNNSLAAATGQIVIQPVANSHKKKLKTSQVFRQTDEDLITGMHKILDYVKNHEDAWPFTDPVDEDYAPNYYTVIRKPMDLQRMEERLDAGYYKNFAKFRDDFQLIVDNCRLYNGAENEYTEMVDNLLKVFERATEKFLDQISSSDDEIAVEYQNSDSDVKETKRSKSDTHSKNLKRKPTLAAKTDKKREHSLSEESLGKRSLSYDSLVDTNDDEKISFNKKDKGNKKLSKTSKKDKNENKKNVKDKKGSRTNNKHKKEKFPSPIRSRSPSRSMSRNSFIRSYSSSPPPSSVPSSPDNRFDFFPKKQTMKSYDTKDTENHSSTKGKQKQKQDKFRELFDQDDTNSVDSLKKQNEKSVLASKPKDKHNKLRETIEKLKAKSEISNKLNDDEFHFDLDTPKENKEKTTKDKDEKIKNNNKKEKSNKGHLKRDLDFEDSNSTMESIHADNNKKTKKNSKSSGIKNASIEALTIATEQTLKDINKWLDDTPKFSEFSSASNSPSYTALDDFDLVNKIDNDPRKKVEKFNHSKKDGGGKDVKRRTFSRDPSKFLKRREVQRTIDRLQPGKSKGNLISSVQNSKQTDELFPLGPLSKNKDTKNSLIVKTDDNAPKLSLGSVLDSFGRHKFVDDNAKSEETNDDKTNQKTSTAIVDDSKENNNKDVKLKAESENKESPAREESSGSSSMMSGATPNLSAWFKAFGAPKIQSAQKNNKADSSKADGKENDKVESTAESKSRPEDVSGKVPVPDLSPNTDSPVMPHGQPIPRQRKISTGSSVSERSSFSQDMDSPRVGIDERLGAYPAPYPSPLHRSPSGASPVMASPRPDVSPKAAPYPPFNGQIRVGFYQDTVSNKSSPDKSCSPRDNPQSPYAQCSEHVYTPNTTQNMAYSYYSHPPNYSNTNPTPPYNPDGAYYDTSKSLTDQYQAKANNQTYNTVGSPSPHPHSPNMDAFRQEDQNQNKVSDKLMQTAVFPVKKRAYNESESAQMRYEAEMSRNLQQMDSQTAIQNVNDSVQSSRPEEPLKHYIHQNIPEPKPLTVQTNVDSYSNKTQSSVSPVQQQMASPVINYSSAPANPYGSSYGNESNYPLNIPAARKMDMPKYTNMGYAESEVNFSRSMQQYTRSELTYARPPSNGQQPTCSNQQVQQQQQQQQQQQNPDVPLLYTANSNPPPPHMGYKSMDINPASNPQQAHTNYTNTSVHTNSNRLAAPQPLDVQGSYKSNEVSIPRPTYNTHLEMDQPLGLRGNIANLSHIVDRYNNDDRMLGSLQTPVSQYYGDKGGLGGPPPHMFNKPISTSSSGLPIFNQSSMAMQSYNQNMQATTSSMYNRQMTELQNSVMTNEAKNSAVQQQGMEKKSKKRKSSKAAAAQAASVAEPAPPSASQGFQSYAGLKSNSPMEPSAISLKTASVVPGSAFNFGPTPTGLSIGSGLYGDKDAYPNFLEDFRAAAPNYYIAAATAAHHRSTPDAADKQTRVAAHQSSTRQGPGYPFIGTRQATPPSYPLGSHFMPSAQAQLMDAGSPLYQHYLQAGVLNQGLLGPPGPYPPGYHPALSMRQPYDSMTRPPWL